MENNNTILTMDESITIRTASANDAEALVSLAIKTFRDTFDDVNTPENMMLYLTKNFTLKRTQEEITEKGSVFFIAEQDDQVIGYARVRRSAKPEGVGEGKAIEIERLYADKKYIGKRVGFLLMTECIQYAREHKFDVVWLGVWEHNERAITFYKRWGFETFSDHIFMLGNDAQTDLLMKKSLI